MKVLLVEDDQSLVDVLTQTLINHHYLVDTATDGKTGWDLAATFEYDLILLDLRLPGLDGIEICQRLRRAEDTTIQSPNLQTPILLITAQDTSFSKVTGLDAGADDYIVKPVDINELLARMRALLRRSGSKRSPVLNWEGLELDPSTCDVKYQGHPLRLTAKEYKLLELLLRHPQQIFSHDKLVEHLWVLDEMPTDSAIRAHIKGLRKKLKAVGAEDVIETIYGLGYRLKAAKKAEVNQISQMWERYRKTYCDRLAIIQQATTALQNHTLTEELRQQAQQEAHTLKGSLGLFGLDAASQLSQMIERLLNSPDLLNHISSLSNSVTQLQTLLHPTPPPPTPAFPPAPAAPSSSSPVPAQLLLLTTDADLFPALANAANRWHIQVQLATRLSQAREMITQSPPNIVALDLTAYSHEEGVDFLTDLANNEPPIPSLILTEQDDFAERMKLAKLGGKGILQKPIAPDHVLHMGFQVLQRLTPTTGKVLIVDDDAIVLDQLHSILQPWGFDLILLSDPQRFWDTLAATHPDLIILDIEMPGVNGIDLCQVVRNDQQWGDLPILFLSAHTDEPTIQQVFSAGADDYIGKPIRAAELVARVLNRLKTARMLQTLQRLRG
ncbi:response regulator with CheY-like receiver domain and winged-helix DNA-binding domain [Leptolyngbyaceae cyanobacterium JSC-12]|nr:response regulator with CheY-like receiver domain and winged-helix DNA-binding domain [Leptolyngbyaceae cyanobacterium JSC-12]